MTTPKSSTAVKPASHKLPSTAPENKANVLQLTARTGVSEERQLADLATDGIALNAMTAQQFLGTSQPGLSITEMVNSLKDHGRRVNDNDLTGCEQLLTAQTVALNTIFAEMARRSALNLGEYLDASERYMRLALKAQGQCRATTETLAAMKNPPIVFAKQANISNGPQQVNNGAPPMPRRDPEPIAAHGKSEKTKTKLLESTQDGGTYLDSRAAAAPSRGDKTMEAVGAVHGTNKRGGQGRGCG